MQTPNIYQQGIYIKSYSIQHYNLYFKAVSPILRSGHTRLFVGRYCIISDNKLYVIISIITIKTCRRSGAVLCLFRTPVRTIIAQNLLYINWKWDHMVYRPHTCRFRLPWWPNSELLLRYAVGWSIHHHRKH